jgi:hypothetical protein
MLVDWLGFAFVYLVCFPLVLIGTVACILDLFRNR